MRHGLHLIDEDPGDFIRWGQVEEERFMHMLLDANTQGPIIDPAVAERHFQDISTRLSRQFRRTIPIPIVRLQYESLRERYFIFQRVLSYDGVVHRQDSNVLVIPPNVKVMMRQEFPESNRYNYFGEARWDLLQEIFAMPEEEVSTIPLQIVPGAPEMGFNNGGMNAPIIISDSEQSGNPHVASSGASNSRPPRPRPFTNRVNCPPPPPSVVYHYGGSFANDRGSATGDVNIVVDIVRRLHRPQVQSTRTPAQSETISTAASRPRHLPSK